MLYMLLKKNLVGPLLTRIYQHEVVGLDNLPSGGAIIASNHVAFCDSIFLPLAVPRQVYFLAKSDYFTGKGVKGALSRWMFSSLGQLPMDRSGGEKSLASLQAGVEKLRQGQFLGIYPEGTRSPDGRLYRAKVGVARLALQAQVPVIPVGQIGTDDVQPAGSNKVHFKKAGQKIKVRTVIGQPLEFSEYYESASSHKVQRVVADRIIQEICQLSGQDYLPVYASEVKRLMTEKNLSAVQAVAELTQKD